MQVSDIPVTKPATVFSVLDTPFIDFYLSGQNKIVKIPNYVLFHYKNAAGNHGPLPHSKKYFTY